MTSLSELKIISPKRVQRTDTAWEKFFPYYAGYSETFAANIVETARLPKGSLVYDPWNGSGTTTYVACKLGLNAIGVDINPVMVIAGRARLLAPSEADSLVPLCTKILRHAVSFDANIDNSDPLLNWFTVDSTKIIRSILESITNHLVSQETRLGGILKFEGLSGLAATFYVILFAVCRLAAQKKFRSTNPTWFRYRKSDERRVRVSRDKFEVKFMAVAEEMRNALRLKSEPSGVSKIDLADSTKLHLEADTVDMVLSSPPYCTRIDYTAATRVELAVLNPILPCDIALLRRRMLGSIRVPVSPIVPCETWGETCIQFLKDLRDHTSKASKTYYHKTHLDYFEKLSSSMEKMSSCIKKGGSAVLVVQDSYYKNLHNDLARIVTEMAECRSLALKRREDFRTLRSMSGLNGRTRVYSRPAGAVESVLCFEKF